MRKRLIFIAVIAIGAIAAYALLHSLYKNNNIQPVAATTIQPSPLRDGEPMMNSTADTTTIPYKDVVAHLKGITGKSLIFLSDESQDTSFITGSVLAPLLNSFEEPLNLPITQVDMSDSSEISVVNLEKAFKVQSYPSFILVDSEKGTYSIISSLTFENDDPFNSEELKTWFFENGIWTGPYGKN